ncbi:EPIDERMAL PATTERNING FACTOR-LIKE PROTEIN 1 [Salix viminalis]|uniref:Epidermal patterning factor-like protein n=1 Tax=Salix viminalis TaxID=40686 RepID=A0A9Q0UVJ5_SALVM|nr:EPIDERMAL PATTERNING FACTOR-LIKE PROTEIN 1 [Salix viminalis]
MGSCHLFSASRLLLSAIALYFLLYPVSCFDQHSQPPSPPHKGIAFEEKARLGSTPPSCYSKCNGCHPCIAVQVPTLPSQNEPFQMGSAKTRSIDKLFDSYPAGNRYPDYRPLGWKCRCADHFYNPLT